MRKLKMTITIFLVYACLQKEKSPTVFTNSENKKRTISWGLQIPHRLLPQEKPSKAFTEIFFSLSL